MQKCTTVIDMHWQNGWLKKSKNWRWLKLQGLVCVSDQGWASLTDGAWEAHTTGLQHTGATFTLTLQPDHTQTGGEEEVFIQTHRQKEACSHIHTHQDACNGKTHTHTDLRSSSPLTDRCEHSLIHTDTRLHMRYRGSTALIQWYFPCKLLIKQRNQSNFTGCNCVIHSCSG